jgi:hypothetical protein
MAGMNGRSLRDGRDNVTTRRMLGDVYYSKQ